jgi:hypothetical protein
MATLSLDKIDGKKFSQIVFDSNREGCKAFMQKAKFPEFSPLILRANGLKRVYVPIATRDSMRLWVSQRDRYIVEVKSIDENKLVIYKPKNNDNFKQDSFLEQVRRLGNFNPKKRFYICYQYAIINNDKFLHRSCFIEPIDKSAIKNIIRQDCLIKEK